MEYPIHINDQPLSVKDHDGISFEIYSGADLLGIITPEVDPDLGLIWTTEDEPLKAIREQVGEAIERLEI